MEPLSSVSISNQDASWPLGDQLLSMNAREIFPSSDPPLITVCCVPSGARDFLGEEVG